MEVACCDVAVFSSYDTSDDSAIRHAKSVDRFFGYSGAVGYDKLHDVGVDTAKALER